MQFLSPPPLQWHAFCFPELKNFLRMLQREEEEHVKQIVQRYALARTKMQETLAGSTPGWGVPVPGINRALLGWTIVWWWPVIAASKDPREYNSKRLLGERESETGRKTMRELARMCVWDDARDEKCLTPGESDVPERMSGEKWRLADETAAVPVFGHQLIILYLSCVTLALKKC